MRPRCSAILRIDQLAAQRLEALERALLVRPHQPRVARDVSRQYGGEPALDAQLLPGIHRGSPLSERSYSSPRFRDSQSREGRPFRAIGDIRDLYQAYGIDADAILDAAARTCLLAPRTNPVSPLNGGRR